MERILTVNGIAFTTTHEEHITARLLKELWGAEVDDRVMVERANGEPPYQLGDQEVIPHDVNRVSIVPASGSDITETVEKISSEEADAWLDALLDED